MSMHSVEHFFYRMLGIAALLFLACLPGFVGFWVAVEIVEDPLHARPVLWPVLGGCLLSLYILALIIWRAATWSTSRRDGGLLPPFVMYAFMGAFCCLLLFASYIGFTSGEYFKAVKALLAALGGVAIALTIRQRSVRSRSDNANQNDPTTKA